MLEPENLQVWKQKECILFFLTTGLQQTQY